MDNPGWHARKKAARAEVRLVSPFAPIHFTTCLAHTLFGLAQESALPASRGPDGRFCPVEAVELTEEVVIGGWVFSPTQTHSPYSTQPDGHENVPESPPSLSPSIHQAGYPFIRQLSELDLHGQNVSPRFYETPSLQLRPVERSEKLNVKRKIMEPYLQFICGPLLRYDTIDENGVWHGAALIVSKCRFDPRRTSVGDNFRLGDAPVAVDAGSTYETYPILTYSWNPADPMGQHNLRQEDDEHLEQQYAVEKHILGTELYVYSGHSGYVITVRILTLSWLRTLCVYLGAVSTYTFWRFLIQIPLSDSEMKIQYTINDGIAIDFFVPGRHQAMRLAAYSVSDPDRHRLVPFQRVQRP